MMIFTNVTYLLWINQLSLQNRYNLSVNSILYIIFSYLIKVVRFKMLLKQSTQIKYYHRK